MPSPSLSIELVYGAMLGAGCCNDLSPDAALAVPPQADADMQATMSAPVMMVLDNWCAIGLPSSALPFADICYSTLMAEGEGWVSESKTPELSVVFTPSFVLLSSDL